MSTGIYWWLDKYVDISSFKVYLDDKFKNGNGYYSWSGIRYFLFEYELNLKNKTMNNTQKINWLDYINAKHDHITIEHIYPQNDSDPYWKGYYASFSTEEKRYICNSLGNLLPLSRNKNSKLQNYSFETKKTGIDDFDIIGYKNGSYAEQEVNEKQQWSIKEIEERGLKLLDFLSERWSINIPDKATFLFLPNFN